MVQIPNKLVSPKMIRTRKLQNLSLSQKDNLPELKVLLDQNLTNSWRRLKKVTKTPMSHLALEVLRLIKKNRDNLFFPRPLRDTPLIR